MGEEDGVALNVSVDHALRVEDRQCLQDRQTYSRNLLLVHPEEGRRHRRHVPLQFFSSVLVRYFLFLEPGSDYEFLADLTPNSDFSLKIVAILFFSSST